MKLLFQKRNHCFPTPKVYGRLHRGAGRWVSDLFLKVEGSTGYSEIYRRKLRFFPPPTVSRASASGFALRSELGRRRECRKRTKGVSSLSPVFNEGEWITLSIYIPETHSRILAWRVPMDRGAWRAKSPWGHKESDATERLSTHPGTHTSLQQSGRQHSWCPSAESIHGNPPSCLHGASSRFPSRGPNLGLDCRRWSRRTLLHNHTTDGSRQQAVTGSGKFSLK